MRRDILDSERCGASSRVLARIQYLPHAVDMVDKFRILDLCIIHRVKIIGEGKRFISFFDREEKRLAARRQNNSPESNVRRRLLPIHRMYAPSGFGSRAYSPEWSAVKTQKVTRQNCLLTSFCTFGNIAFL